MRTCDLGSTIGAKLCLGALLTFAASCQSVAPVVLAAAPVSAEGPRSVELASASEAPAAPAASAPVESWRSIEARPFLQGDSAAPSQAVSGAEEYSPNLYRRFGLSVGGVAFGNFDTSVRLSSPFLVGVNLDLEDFLGVDNSAKVFRIDADYSFNKRHRLDFSYYDIVRNGSAVVSDPIEVGDVVLPAGEIRTSFNTRILKLAYRYNFVTDVRTTLGVSGGFHTMRLNTSVGAPGFNLEETFKVTAPLPLLGLHGAYALSDKWRLRASIEFLQVSLGDLDGFISDRILAIDHDTFEHFGWGVGFNGFVLDATVKEGNLRADVEYAYQGLLLYVRTYF